MTQVARSSRLGDAVLGPGLVHFVHLTLRHSLEAPAGGGGTSRLDARGAYDRRRRHRRSGGSARRTCSGAVAKKRLTVRDRRAGPVNPRSVTTHRPARAPGEDASEAPRRPSSRPRSRRILVGPLGPEGPVAICNQGPRSVDRNVRRIHPSRANATEDERAGGSFEGSHRRNFDDPATAAPGGRVRRTKGSVACGRRFVRNTLPPQRRRFERPGRFPAVHPRGETAPRRRAQSGGAS